MFTRRNQVWKFVWVGGGGDILSHTRRVRYYHVSRTCVISYYVSYAVRGTLVGMCDKTTRRTEVNIIADLKMYRYIFKADGFLMRTSMVYLYSSSCHRVGGSRTICMNDLRTSTHAPWVRPAITTGAPPPHKSSESRQLRVQDFCSSSHLKFEPKKLNKIL